MACYFPLKAYRATSPNRNGNYPVIVVPRGKIGSGATMRVPCGQCIGCRLDRARDWAVRCVHEAQMHEDNCFLTLTYEDEHLPPYEGLSKRDLQLFFKRLRKRLGKLRYFACGEYGEQFGRPHYHVILFGKDFADKKPLTDVLFESDLLSEVWGKGLCSIGEVSFESAGYVARYSMKKVSGKEDRAANAGSGHYVKPCVYTGELMPVIPEYNTMSLKPGIGRSWLEKYHRDVFPDDFVVIAGRKFPAPQYYLTQLNQPQSTFYDPDLHQKILEKRTAKLKEYDELGENDWRRLESRYKVKLAQVGQLQRSL